MESDEFTRNVFYRLMNGACRDRLDPLRHRETPEQVRADPLKGLRIHPNRLADHQIAETIQQATEDAIE